MQVPGFSSFSGTGLGQIVSNHITVQWLLTPAGDILFD